MATVVGLSAGGTGLSNPIGLVATTPNVTIGGTWPNQSISVSAGAVGGSSPNSRTSTSFATDILEYQAGVGLTMSFSKGFALYSIQTSAGAWIVVYSSTEAMNEDNDSSIGRDPASVKGVIAESITTSPTTTYFTPAIFGYNAETPPVPKMYFKIYNNSEVATGINVTITYLILEA